MITSYQKKQMIRLIRMAKQDVSILQNISISDMEMKKVSHHARRAYNALDTLQSCLGVHTVYSALLSKEIERLYLTEDMYVGCGC